MFKKLWLKFLMWMMQRTFFHFIVMKIVPYLRFSVYYSKPSNKKYPTWGPLAYKGYQILQPGDLIFSLDAKKLLTFVIGKATADSDPSLYPFVPAHAALCVAKDSDFEVAEMTHHNYTKSTWMDVCSEATRVVIARCEDFDQSYIDNVLIPTCLSFEDKKYDVKFIQGIDELACSEMVYFSDAEHRLNVKLEPIMGLDPYISPVGLLNAKNCKVVWDSDLEE
ncbi:MAG: hypothetical protein PHY47_00060 [Lachnospiraceae bacterium]|nr:hypothetical protein [Lachnospiraceae bacterium]